MKASEYELMHRVEPVHWWYRGLRRMVDQHLQRYLPQWPDLDLLDAGCGTGATLVHLGRRTTHVGLDWSKLALQYCAQSELPLLARGAVMRLPFADESFDVVLCNSVIYHQWVPDPVAALREMHRVLRRGGWLLLDVPALDCLSSAHDEAVLTARRFDRPTLRKDLAGAGFDVARLTYWNMLLLPAVYLARRFGLLAMGRDFGLDYDPSRFVPRVLDGIMHVDTWLAGRMNLPIGVSLSGVARKPT